MEQPQPEEIIALSINSFDAWAEKVQEDGIDLNARVDRLVPLLLKISDPKILDLLEKTLDQHEAIDKALDIGKDIPNLVSTGVDSFDDFAERLQNQGVDLSARLDRLLPLFIKLSDPKILNVVEKTADKHELFEQLLKQIDEAPGIISTAVDTIDAFILRGQEQGIDIDERLNNLFVIMEILTSTKVKRSLEFVSVHIDRFLHIGELFIDIDRFNEKFAVFLEDLTTSMVQTTDCPPQSVGGIFDVLKRLKDKDVSRAMGFGFRFAKKFGEKLNAKI